ncbi:MAG TPA: hypothetical protein H9987_07550 [Candidatus Luteococcus avicola]|nr:hypothetical protein [Candidatus Luteococcus avicola]
MARGSTRSWFGTREDLLTAALEHMAQQGNAVLSQAADEVDGAMLEPGVMNEETQAAAMRAMASGTADDDGQQQPAAEREETGEVAQQVCLLALAEVVDVLVQGDQIGLGVGRPIADVPGSDLDATRQPPQPAMCSRPSSAAGSWSSTPRRSGRG